MCMVLYAAADAPLQEFPQSTPPAPLSARLIEGTEEAVRPHFTKPYVYFLGSHTGCSCGFQYGEGIEEDSEGRESVRQLGEYLVAAVQCAGAVEVYACWDGEEAEPVEEREVVTPAAFSGDTEEFDLPQRWLATVVPAAS